MTERRKIIIIGSGPAAYTAAIYAARADLKPLVIAGFMAGGTPGGQLMTTTEVENYPGFANGITGPELMKAFEDQARRFEAEILFEDVVELSGNTSPFQVKTNKSGYEAQAVIIATGAYAKRMDIPGDKEFWTKGVSACAVCDGALPLFRGKPVVVVGGGDSACEEGVFMTKYASKVYLVLRRDAFRASKIMAERAIDNEKIEVVYKHVLKEIKGDKLVTHAVLESVEDKKEREVEVAGVFYAIGHTPSTNFIKSDVKKDEAGYLIREGQTSYTSVEGIFVAGDVTDKNYRQAVTAAGMGCMAALDAERWLTKKGLIHA